MAKLHIFWINVFVMIWTLTLNRNFCDSKHVRILRLSHAATGENRNMLSQIDIDEAPNAAEFRNLKQLGNIQVHEKGEPEGGFFNQSQHHLKLVRNFLRGELFDPYLNIEIESRKKRSAQPTFGDDKDDDCKHYVHRYHHHYFHHDHHDHHDHHHHHRHDYHNHHDHHYHHDHHSYHDHHDNDYHHEDRYDHHHRYKRSPTFNREKHCETIVLVD